MGDRSRQLEQVIAREQQNLGDNLEELGRKARDLTDWRAQVRARPLRMLGLAAAGGVVVAAMTRGGRRRRGKTEHVADLSRGSPLVRNIRAALGVLAAKSVAGVLARTVPGFHKQLRRLGPTD